VLYFQYNDTKFYKNNQTKFLAAHFAKRNTKFGGGGKIGIGKQGRAKIPSPQPPSPAPEQVRYGTSLFARPSVQFLPSRQRREQSVGVLFKKGSKLKKQFRP